jgi:hypothetical protein
MISSKDQSRLGEPLGGGYSGYQAPEILRLHASVTSAVIDLVRGGLDQQICPIFYRLIHGGFENPRMCRTDRVSSLWVALAPCNR